MQTRSGGSEGPTMHRLRSPRRSIGAAGDRGRGQRRPRGPADRSQRAADNVGAQGNEEWRRKRHFGHLTRQSRTYEQTASLRSCVRVWSFLCGGLFRVAQKASSGGILDRRVEASGSLREETKTKSESARLLLGSSAHALGALSPDSETSAHHVHGRGRVAARSHAPTHSAQARCSSTRARSV